MAPAERMDELLQAKWADDLDRDRGGPLVAAANSADPAHRACFAAPQLRRKALARLYELFEGHDAAAEITRLKEEDEG